MKFRDYYDVLGVPRTATEKDIQRAYRKLAREVHPDLQAPEARAKATEHFKEINEAYEVLGDPEKRRRYDALGANWRAGQDFTPPAAGGFGGWTTERAPTGGAEAQWEDFGDFSDFFASMFGGRAGTRPGTRGARPGSDVEAELLVTIEELITGGRRRLSLDGDQTIEVKIPPATRNGTVLRVAGHGGSGRGGGAAGDLYLRLRAEPHPRFRIQGDDLEVDLPLWPWQAMLGTPVHLQAPDGSTVKVQVPPGTQGGGRLRLRGMGLPKGGEGRGDLHAAIRLVNPEHPTSEEREAYEALKRASKEPEDQPAKP